MYKEEAVECCEKARNLANEEKYEEAVCYYNRAIEIDSNNLSAYVECAWALQDMKEYDLSLTYLNKANEIKPNDEIILFYMGFSFDKLEMDNKAIECYDMAIESNPEVYDAYYNKARCLYLLYKYEEANVVFSQAIDVNPNDHEAYQNKGMTLVKLGKLEEAIIFMDKALELNPDNKKAFFHKRAISFEKRGKTKKAEEYYKKARKYT